MVTTPSLTGISADDVKVSSSPSSSSLSPSSPGTITFPTLGTVRGTQPAPTPRVPRSPGFSFRHDHVEMAQNQGLEYGATMRLLALDDEQRQASSPASPPKLKAKGKQVTRSVPESAMKKASSPTASASSNGDAKRRKGVRFGQGTKRNDEDKGQSIEDIGIFDLTDFDNAHHAPESTSEMDEPTIRTIPPTPEKQREDRSYTTPQSLPVPSFLSSMMESKEPKRKPPTSPTLAPPADHTANQGLRVALRRTTSSGSINATTARARKDSGASLRSNKSSISSPLASPTLGPPSPTVSNGSNTGPISPTIPSSSLAREAAMGKYIEDDEDQDENGDDDTENPASEDTSKPTPYASSLPIQISYLNPFAAPDPLSGRTSRLNDMTSDDPVRHASYMASRAAMRPSLPEEQNKQDTYARNASVAGLNKSLMEQYKARQKTGQSSFAESYMKYTGKDDHLEPGSLAEYQHATGPSGLFGPTPRYMKPTVSSPRKESVEASSSVV